MGELVDPGIRVQSGSCPMRSCNWGWTVPRYLEQEVADRRYIDEVINKHLHMEHGLTSVLIAQHEKQTAVDASYAKGFTDGKQELAKVVRQQVREGLRELIRDTFAEED